MKGLFISSMNSLLSVKDVKNRAAAEFTEAWEDGPPHIMEDWTTE